MPTMRALLLVVLLAGCGDAQTSVDAALPDAVVTIDAAPADAAPADAAPADAAPADAGADATPGCAADLTADLAPVIDGLLYLSESDYPFEMVSVADAGNGAITAAHLRDLLGYAAGTVMETRTLDEFFTAYLLGGADGDRYTEMRAILEAHLTDLTVIRLDTIQVHVYVVGRTACGEIAGVTTISVET
jgi:hypothetical protein